MSSDERNPKRVSLQHHGITIGDLVLVPANADVGADAMTLQVVAQVAPHIALVADACRGGCRASAFTRTAGAGA